MNATPPSPSRLLKVYAAFAQMVDVAASDRLAGAGAGLGSAAWLDCAANRRASPRPGNRGQRASWGYPCASAASAARSEGLMPSFELHRRGAAGPAGARRRCACRAWWRRCRRARCGTWASSSSTSTARARHPARRRRPHLRGRPGLLAQQRQRRPRRRLVLQPDRVRDPRRHRALDRRAARRAAAGAGAGRLRGAQRRAAPRAAPGRHAAAAWGERFTLRGLFRQPLLSARHGHWQEWDGQLHGDFSRVDVSQLRRYANLGVEVSEGHGAVRAWADVVEGQLTGGAADLVLADVSTQLGPRLPAAGAAIDLGPPGRQAPGRRLRVRDPGPAVPDPGRPALARRQPVRALDARPRAAGRRRASCAPTSSTWSREPDRHPAAAGHARRMMRWLRTRPKGWWKRLQASWQGPLDALQQVRGARPRGGSRWRPAAIAAAHAGTPGHPRRDGRLRPDPGRRQGQAAAA